MIIRLKSTYIVIQTNTEHWAIDKKLNEYKRKKKERLPDIHDNNYFICEDDFQGKTAEVKDVPKIKNNVIRSGVRCYEAYVR